MIADGKLLAQDDIDALLGEAGTEGINKAEGPEEESPKLPKKSSAVRFAKRSESEVKDSLSLLHNKAFLEREHDVQVIWNALGTIPMVTGLSMKIQDREYVSLGVLHVNHLVVTSNG